MMTKPNFSQALISVILLCAVAQAFGSTENPSCSDYSITAGAVRTTEDVQAFVQCAYEFVQEAGFEEARRAFHEDERWRRGQVYVFVSEVTPMTDQTRNLVFPPDPAREGTVLEELRVDAFGNDFHQEWHRILSTVGEGWIYYAFTNPATGGDEPKATYAKSLDWDGTPAAIGSGIYRRDIPGTCNSEEVNAMGLETDPSEERLQEFVRCAAMELESKGYFATIALATDPRWKHGSIYLFAVGTHGSALFSGDPHSGQPGTGVSELNDMMDGPLRWPGRGERGGCVRRNLAVLHGAQPRQRRDATQSDFRQEGRGPWSADPGRRRLLSGQGHSTGVGRGGQRQ